jgi:hypothetical protein
MATSYQSDPLLGSPGSPPPSLSKGAAPRGPLLVWATQFQTLLRKNVIVLWHRKVTSCLLLLLPCAFIIGLALLQSALGSSSNNDIVVNLEKCETFTVYGKVGERLGGVQE